MNYHEDYESVSASMLKVLMKSPLLYYMVFVLRSIKLPESKDLQFGSMFHTSVLEPDIFEDRYVTLPAFEFDPGNVTAKGERSDSKATSYYKSRVKEFSLANVGKTFVSQDDLNLVSAMTRAAWSHKDLNAMLKARGDIETPIYWEDRIKKRCKPDKVIQDYHVILDLKTCDEANPANFANSCGKFGYFLQAAWYREALLETTGHDYRFIFAAISKKPPHEVGLYELKTEDIAWAESKAEQLVDELIGRTKTGDWLSSWQTGINEISLPRWVRNDWYLLEEVE